jgi:hypothetical protein
MAILIGVAGLLGMWVLVCLVLDGYPSMVDTWALALKRHAASVRTMQNKRSAVLAEAWIRELEK